MKQIVLDFFKGIAPEYYHIEDAAYILRIHRAQEVSEFFDVARQLTEEGLLMSKDHVYYRYNDKEKEIEGIYKGYRKSFGFVVGPDLQEDVYIDVANKAGAMHNDKVRVKIIGEGGQGRKKEGKVTAILERANETIVGTYDRQKQFGFVIPDDERIGEDVYVALKDTMEARSGAKVLVQITEWPVEGRRPEGKIIEILGYEGDTGLDISCIMAKHKIPFSFPEDVLAESTGINLTVSYDRDRLDLRDKQIITIDGEDAKDLDDAVSVDVLPNGHYQLGVHIADVSHYVQPRSEIDKEAYKRGTSVYLVDRVVPMLPVVLSNGICSLNAHEDRYAMTCLMEINEQGKVVDFTISPSMINVERRCNYKEIYKALKEDIIPDDLQPFMGLVHRLHEVAKILMAMRQRRGALDFDFPEYRVLLDHEGKPLQIVKRERTIAEQIIEECMLIANETVATFLKDTGNPSVYRIHEEPNSEKLEALQTVVRYLGKELVFKGDQIEPREIQALLKSVAHTDVEKIAQIMTLRSMQQAKYSAINVGHFGLASECYTHFTSPIRRYPDLMIHRLLKKTLRWKNGYIDRDGKESYLARAAEHSSVQEQVAVSAERETDDLKKTEYMLPFLGQVFTAHVNSITSFGMFVELDNGIDGLVHISMLDDDYYFYDEEHFLLVGRRTGKIYHLGQEVTVTLAKVDLDRRQIDFVIGEITDLAELERRMNKNRPSNKDKSTKAKGKLSEKGEKDHRKEGHGEKKRYSSRPKQAKGKKKPSSNGEAKRSKNKRKKR